MLAICLRNADLLAIYPNRIAVLVLTATPSDVMFTLVSGGFPGNEKILACAAAGELALIHCPIQQSEAH